MELTNVELFSSLTNQEVHEIEQIARRMHLGRGEIVFREGDFENSLYVVESGQVEIFKRDPLQGEQVVAVFKNGDFFGEMALFDKNAPRSATARTLQTTVLVVIEGKDFERLLFTRPSISLKLLATLSKRLRNTTTSHFLKGGTSAKQTPSGCRLLAVASAKDGFGKTTFASTLAHLLAAEVAKKILFIDLDLYFADGTFAMGVHSPKSIVELANRLRSTDQEFDILGACVKTGENLWVLPAPTNFLDAEKLSAADALAVLKAVRSRFDYVVVDTASMFDDVLLNILDTADLIFFLADAPNVLALKDNVRFFQGIAKLNYPRDRIVLLGSKVDRDFTIEKTAKMYPFPVRGGIPSVADLQPDYGKSVYHSHPSGAYCEVIRLLVRNILKETQINKPVERGIWQRLFASEPAPVVAPELQIDAVGAVGGPDVSPIIPNQDVKALIKFVRYNLLYGHVKVAKTQILNYLDFAQASGPLYELLGEILALEQSFSEAIEAFHRSLAADPQNHLAMGFLACMTGDETAFKQAVKIVSDKLAQHPGFADLHNDKAKLHLQHGDHDLAEECCREALKINPRFLDAQINLATSLAARTRTDEAISLLLAVKEKNARIFMLLGQMFHDTGRLFLAHQSYLRAEEQYPEYPGLRQRLSELTTYFKRLSGVIVMHQGFVETHPQFPDMHVKLGNFLQIAGRTELAVREYQEALRIKPQYHEALDKLAALESDTIGRLAAETFATILPVGDERKLLGATFKLQVLLQAPAEKSCMRIDVAWVLRMKNVRTGKVLQKPVVPDELKSGSVTVDCEPLGVIAPQDIIVAELIEATTGQIYRAEPYYVEVPDLEKGTGTMALTADPSTGRSATGQGIRYFLVHLDSKQIAEIIGGTDSEYRAVVANAANGLEAVGQVNPENDAQVNFVLIGTNGTSANAGDPKSAAVRRGDHLVVRVTDRAKNEVFSMDFTVEQRDIESFSKLIVHQDIA